MEAASTVEAASAAPEAIAIKATVSEATASAEAGSAAIEAASSKEAALTEAATTEAMEPRASPDEESVKKPIRAVVAVRRAIVWVITVIAVGAQRSGAPVARANSNANRNLRMGRKSRREHANRQ